MPLSRQELELRLEEATRVLATLRRCTLDMQEVRRHVFAGRRAATDEQTTTAPSQRHQHQTEATEPLAGPRP